MVSLHILSLGWYRKIVATSAKMTIEYSHLHKWYASKPDVTWSGWGYHDPWQRKTQKRLLEYPFYTRLTAANQQTAAGLIIHPTRSLLLRYLDRPSNSMVKHEDNESALHLRIQWPNIVSGSMHPARFIPQNHWNMDSVASCCIHSGKLSWKDHHHLRWFTYKNICPPFYPVDLEKMARVFASRFVNQWV